MEDEELTTISLKKSTRDRLASIVLKDEKFDKVISDLLDLAKEKEYLYNKIRDEAKKG